MRDYPERFPVGACQQSARWMVKLHPELTYVEGYLVFVELDGTERRMEHAWNETPDGQVVDSTAWAYTDVLRIDRYERDSAAWMRLTVAIDNLTNPKGTSAP